MTTTLCASSAIVLKAGVNATVLPDASYTTLINEAEGFVCASSRYDWVANYASVSTIGKTILEDATSARAAIVAINYDMSGFSNRQEAQVMLDVNYSLLVDCINLLRDDKFRQFVLDGSVA